MPEKHVKATATEPLLPEVPLSELDDLIQRLKRSRYGGSRLQILGAACADALAEMKDRGCLNKLTDAVIVAALRQQ